MKLPLLLITITLFFTTLLIVTDSPFEDSTSTAENGIFISSTESNSVYNQVDEEIEMVKQTEENIVEEDAAETVEIPVSSRLSAQEPGSLDLHHPSAIHRLSPGVNLAAAEFAPDDPNYAHSYPIQSLDYYAQKGFKLFRLPFRWERMQPTLYGPLSQTELDMMDAFLAKAEELQVYVILDVHNYARYRNEVVGTEAVPTSSLVDFWQKMVEVYKDHPAVVAYGTMNEPHDTGNTWHPVAQEVVYAIREIDQETLITVCGDNWSGAYSWKSVNNNMVLDDPSNRLLYEAHVYFDAWNVGAYNCTYDTCGVTENLVSERIDPFIEWLDENDAYGYIGEYGVPSDDQRWIQLMGEFYNRINEERLGSTIWAGGPYWGAYVLSVEPEKNGDQIISEKPQITYLEQFLEECQKIGDDCIIRLDPDRDQIE